jgi:hypothetical protein
MSAIYTVSFAGTVTNAGGNADLLEIVPADDKPVRLRGFILGNYSEFGDSTEEAINISVLRLPATFTTGNGTSTTPRKPDDLSAAAGFTAEVNGATIATTSGTIEILMEFAWNIRSSPFEFWFPDIDFCPMVRGGDGLIIRMASTLADDVSMANTFFLEE